MTEVKFFFNVDNRLQFSCRLAKRAYDEGKRLIVYSPHLGKVEEFDRTLWTFSQLSFVPHVRSHHPLASETPIVVAMDESHLPHYDALLNLDDDPPPFFSRFEFQSEFFVFFHGQPAYAFLAAISTVSMWKPRDL